MTGSRRTSGMSNRGGLSVANLLIVPIRSSLPSRTTDLTCACGCVQVRYGILSGSEALSCLSCVCYSDSFSSSYINNFCSTMIWMRMVGGKEEEEEDKEQKKSVTVGRGEEKIECP